MKSTWNPKLGEGSNKLLGAFMGQDMLAAQAGDEYGAKYASQLSNLASAKKHAIEAGQLEEAGKITPDEFALAQGVPKEILAAYRQGQPVDQAWKEIMQRVDTVHLSRRMGGGNVQQILAALQTGQQIAPVDSVSTGKRTPESAAILETLSAQKPLYSSEEGQVMNVATGATRDTPLSLAKIAKLKGEAGEEGAGTPGAQFDAILGKGSWKKLTPDAQAVVFQAMKAGQGPDMLVNTMRQHYAEPSINEVLRLWSANPMTAAQLMQNSRDPTTGQFDTTRFQAAIQQMLQAARGAAQGVIDTPRGPAAAGTEMPPITAQDILGNMGSRPPENAILGKQPLVGGPSAVTHRFNPATGRIEPVR